MFNSCGFLLAQPDIWPLATSSDIACTIFRRLDLASLGADFSLTVCSSFGMFVRKARTKTFTVVGTYWNRYAYSNRYGKQNVK